MNTVLCEIMRSVYDSKYYALSIEDKRHGIDAGPWRLVATAIINLSDISAVKALERRLKSANKVINGFENIKELWLPEIIDKAHVDEAKALHKAHDNMLYWLQEHK